MPLILQSKVFNFQQLCQLTRAQATETWAPASASVPGEYPWTQSTWQGTHSAVHGMKQSPVKQSSTWEEERGRKCQGKEGKRIVWEKQSGSGREERGKSEQERDRNGRNGSMNEPVWLYLFVYSFIFFFWLFSSNCGAIPVLLFPH